MHSSAGTSRGWAIFAAAIWAALIFYVSGFAELVRIQHDHLRSAVGAIVGLNGTLLGFLVSAGALLYAIANTRLATNLQRTQHFNRLVNDLFRASGVLFSALLISVVVLFMPGAPTTPGTGVAQTAQSDDLFVLAIRVLVSIDAAALVLLVPIGYTMRSLLMALQPDTPGKLEFSGRIEIPQPTHDR